MFVPPDEYKSDTLSLLTNGNINGEGVGASTGRSHSKELLDRTIPAIWGGFAQNASDILH